MDLPDDPAETPQAGWALRSSGPLRLTRDQLGHALEDLLGADPAVVRELPQDLAVGGFDGLAEGQTTSDLWVARWVDVVDRAVEDALRVPTDAVVVSLADAAPPHAQTDDPATGVRWAYFDADGRWSGTLERETAGPVSLTLGAALVIAYDDEAIVPDGVPPQVRLSVDGEAVGDWTVEETVRDRAALAVTLDLAAGPHDVEVAWEVAFPHVLELGTFEAEAVRDTWASRRTLDRDRLLPCDPAVAACLDEAVATLARRAWRTDALDPAIPVLQAHARAAEDPEQGLADVARAVLTSPRFVFRLEPEVEAATPLGPHALATRLALALWRSVPDEALLACADAGGLGDDAGPCGLVAQVDRLLADPRADRFHADFTTQWLELGTLGTDSLRPDLDPGLQAAMRAETARMLRQAVDDGRTVAELVGHLPASVDGALAVLYGAPAPPEGTVATQVVPGRGGVLRTAAVLAATSDPGRTSLVRRGKLLLDRFLCDPVGARPEAAPVDDPEEDAALDAARGRLEDPACTSCHARLDPLGAAFESFDAHGVVRATPDGTLDAALPDGTVPEGADDVVAWLVAEDRTATCIADQLATYLHQRPVSEAHRAATSAALGRAPSGDTSVRDLVVALVTHEAFTHRWPMEAR